MILFDITPRAIKRNCYEELWAKRLGAVGELEPIYQLQRKQQAVLFRLRTDHWRLLSHLHRVKILHTDECPCGWQSTDSRTCYTGVPTRPDTWPRGRDLRGKLWGLPGGPGDDCGLCLSEGVSDLAWPRT